MKYLMLVVSAVMLLNANAAEQGTMDANFNKYKEAYVLEQWKIYPAWASSVGYHKYDNVLVVPDGAARVNEIAFCKKQLDGLHKFDVQKLSDLNKIDYHLVENQLNYAMWTVNDYKSWQWDPSSYNVCGSFADMLGNKYATLEARLKNFSARMVTVPAYYKAAKANISNPTAEHTQLAIEQNEGGISVFQKDLDEAVKASKLTDAEKKTIKERAEKCVAAIQDYADWLKKLDNPNPRDFRLGKALYEKKFEYELQSSLPAEAIFQKALEHKRMLHDHMFDMTQRLWPKYFAGKEMPEDRMEAIRTMIDQLSGNHCPPFDFQGSIERQIPYLVEFITKNDLLTLDPAKPLVVRKEPDYMAGVAGASISAPGPYDKGGNTYYNVGSFEGWTPERTESYLREYNHYILNILNIHEAIPGHYTQLVYANQSPSIIKSILGNNAMIEGWAVYTERMMLDAGYDPDGTPALKTASNEMWMMYDKWNLRSTCNFILDYSVHVRGMTKDDAMRMLTQDAFQEKAEAEGKWRRVSVTQVQLDCYFTGFKEISELREELTQKAGKDKFNLKKFHEKFLSYGSAPVKYIREMMLK